MSQKNKTNRLYSQININATKLEVETNLYYFFTSQFFQKSQLFRAKCIILIG